MTRGLRQVNKAKSIHKIGINCIHLSFLIKVLLFEYFNGIIFSKQKVMTTLNKMIAHHHRAQLQIIHSLPKNKIYSSKNICEAFKRSKSFKQLKILQNPSLIRETVAFINYPLPFKTKNLKLLKLVNKRNTFTSFSKGVEKSDTKNTNYKMIQTTHNNNSDDSSSVAKNINNRKIKFNKENIKMMKQKMQKMINCEGLVIPIRRNQRTQNQKRNYTWIKRIVRRQRPTDQSQKIYNKRKIATIPVQQQDDIDISAWNQFTSID